MGVKELNLKMEELEKTREERAENIRKYSKKRLISVKELATVLDITTVWVRELAKRGTIPAVKHGHFWKFDLKRVEEAYFQSNSYLE